MTEPLIIMLIASGVLCWMVGGTGAKWVRRFLWPAIVASVLGISGQTWGSSIMVSFFVALSATLPYGDRTPRWLRSAVFLAVASPGLLLNLKIWPFVLIAWVLLMGAFIASRKWNWFTHKIWEGFTGFLQASLIVMGVLAR